jgi:hypothetical protein
MKLSSLTNLINSPSFTCEQMDLLLDMLQNVNTTWKDGLTAPKQTIVTNITAQATTIDAEGYTDYDAIDYLTATDEQMAMYQSDPAFREFQKAKLNAP